ncbi:alpha/beta fold hydrolase [Methylocystis sp. S23]
MSWDIWTRDLWAWPIATMDLWRRALELPLADARKEGPQWSTPARLILRLGLLRLWEFATDEAAAPVMIVSPYALHDAQIADLAPGHSLVAALLRGGCGRLYLVEWASATAETQLYGIDALLAELTIAVDEIGAPVDLVGLCQGGWLSLAYAARFPQKTRRLVAVGAPVDVAAARSALAGRVEETTDLSIERLIFAGGGVVKGDHMAPLWPREESEERRLADGLQIELPTDAPFARDAVAAFRAWDRRRLDLPGPYFREVLQYLFRDNLLAKGRFPALGKRVELRGLDRPVYLLAGASDAIAPPAQVFAVKEFIGGEVETALAPCGHLALFMGRRTIENEWPRIAAWLSGKESKDGA